MHKGGLLLLLLLLLMMMMMIVTGKEIQNERGNRFFGIVKTKLRTWMLGKNCKC